MASHENIIQSLHRSLTPHSLQQLWRSAKYSGNHPLRGSKKLKSNRTLYENGIVCREHLSLWSCILFHFRCAFEDRWKTINPRDSGALWSLQMCFWIWGGSEVHHGNVLFTCVVLCFVTQTLGVTKVLLLFFLFQILTIVPRLCVEESPIRQD